MAKFKKNKKTDISSNSEVITEQSNQSAFYFGKENYKWMFIGLGFILVGYLLMMGADANTVNGTYDPKQWNDGIFSVLRIRIAPLLVVIGFAIEAYAILKRTK